MIYYSGVNSIMYPIFSLWITYWVPNNQHPKVTIAEVIAWNIYALNKSCYTVMYSQPLVTHLQIKTLSGQYHKVIRKIVRSNGYKLGLWVYWDKIYKALESHHQIIRWRWFLHNSKIWTEWKNWYIRGTGWEVWLFKKMTIDKDYIV